MFYYADGLIYPDLVKGNQVSAIVGSVKHNHGLAVGLREAKLPWASNWLFVNMPDGLCGQEATERILQKAKAKGKKAEAAEWCSSYAFDGLETGKTFQPSKEELQCVFAYYYKRLNQSFTQLGLNGIQNELYWSSSEYDNYEYYIYNAWVVRPSDGAMVYNDKTSSYRVRCFLAF